MLFRLLQNYYAKYLLTICSIVGGYLALVLLDNYSDHSHTPVCIFKAVTGIPCPGCGMGRATLELLKGNVLKSFDYNILCIPFTLSIIISLIWLLRDTFIKKETFFSFIKQDIKLPFKLILFSIIIADWILNIIRQI